MDGGKKKDRVSTGVGVEEIFNIDEIVTKEQDAPTEPISDKNTKVINANRYATKKTVAQGMLDIALLTSNTSQLKYVLQVGPKHEFYTLLVVLISISIVLQVALGFVLLSLNLLRDCWFHKPRHRDSALSINYLTTAAAFVVTVLNLLVGLLFVVIGGHDHDDQPSAVILNDVIIISALVSVVLSTVFDINYHPDCPRAEILNNVSTVFQIVSVAVNVIISIFYSIEVDSVRYTVI